MTVLANMMYALMCITGRIVQLYFFGELTETEIQLVKERTLNYMLFKIVFMGAILNADVHELLVWTTWFTAMCFLQAFVCVCEERFEMAAENALAGDQRDAVRYLFVALSISFVNVGLALLCWVSFQGAGLSVPYLLFFENIVVMINGMHTSLKYILCIYLGRGFGTPDNVVLMKYVDFCAEFLLQVAMLGHFLQIWKIYGVSFTLIDLFLFMNMRSVLLDMVNSICAFRRYRQALTDIDSRIPDVAPEDLARDDKCAICLEVMTTRAKRLPCRHIFHRHCLEQWVHQKRICPCCRAPITTDKKCDSKHDDVQHLRNGNADAEISTTLPFHLHATSFIRRLFPFTTGTQERRRSSEALQILSEIFPHVSHQVIVRHLDEGPNVRVAVENLLEAHNS
eukprot:CAMPEP_0185252164 /NCGR_PEP_ID=MMETSP1359-20130426/1353_1 /TAXON_ID=552665 /ORGANISM="Bigelowiella longifila, Strain CCMP242" /LENGTH=395 /DNA_ID=CAMNT_0027834275 /DNA_START=120 /DNA_END=1307 /DNA_ORIENTATION=-